MTTKVIISLIHEAELGREATERLHRLVPKEERLFGISLLPEDPRLPEVLRCLHAAGLRPVPTRVQEKARKEFFFNFRRDYDEAELDSFQLLQLACTYARLQTWGRSPLGYARLDFEWLGTHPGELRGVSFVANNLGYFVTESLMHMLVQAGLRHVAFKPTVSYRNESWEHANLDLDPWWEMTADIYMCPLSPTTQLVYDWGRRPVPWGERRGRHFGDGVLPVEAWFDPPELRYRHAWGARGAPLSAAGAEQLEDLPREFDAACTLEPFGPRGFDYHPLICSQKLRRFFKKQRIPAQWIPVHIEQPPYPDPPPDPPAWPAAPSGDWVEELLRQVALAKPA
jgi:hypothetical protein